MATIEQVMSVQRDFAVARDWQQFHTPKNIAMAMGGEAGELCVAIRTLLDTGSAEKLDVRAAAVSDECADVALYLIRLYDILDIEFPIIDPGYKNGTQVPESAQQDSQIVGVLLGLCGSIGRVLEIFQWQERDFDRGPGFRAENSTIVGLLRDVVKGLFELSDLVNVDVIVAAAEKLRANELRYPAQSSRGSTRKYPELEDL